MPGGASLWRAAGRPEGATTDAVAALLELAWSLMTALAIAPLQDVLRLGGKRADEPAGHRQRNWRWRVTEHQLSASAFQSLRALTRASSRSLLASKSLSPADGCDGELRLTISDGMCMV